MYRTMIAWETETDRQTDIQRETESNLVFYTQSTSTVMSERERDV